MVPIVLTPTYYQIERLAEIRLSFIFFPSHLGYLQTPVNYKIPEKGSLLL